MSKVEKITLILLLYEKKQAGADRAPEASFLNCWNFIPQSQQQGAY
jgi:hypothetical protein